VLDKYQQRSINLEGVNAICLPAIRQLTPVTGQQLGRINLNWRIFTGKAGCD
jgi:hypothetical protein